MVKLDYDRDYYADLDLPPAADVVEVKKAFKRLALKYHPDRNRGNEDDAKEKFLVIQAAHEILTDEAQKSKYDAYRIRTARYGASSGVKGNPYMYTSQDVNSKFGPPPMRRPPMPSRPVPTSSGTTSGASRYSNWTPKPKSKTEAFRAKSEAWDRSRASNPNSTSSAKYGSGPPPTPPRSAAQARRQEAAFGARRTGFAPTSPVGDEPPVRNQHYNTYGGSGQSTPTYNYAPQDRPRPTSEYIDPLSKQFGDTFIDNRQRTPYATNLGEKTNPHEPLNNINRAKSMRDGDRKVPSQTAPAPPPRQRSVSADSEGLRRAAANNRHPTNDSNQDSRPQYTSKASARYSPRTAQSPIPDFANGFGTAAAGAAAGFGAGAAGAAFGGPNSSNSSVNSSANATVNGDSSQAKESPKVYDSPLPPRPPPLSARSILQSPLKRKTPFSIQPDYFSEAIPSKKHEPPSGEKRSSAPKIQIRPSRGTFRGSNRSAFSAYMKEGPKTPSGVTLPSSPADPFTPLNPFEEGLNSQLQFLLNSKGLPMSQPAPAAGVTTLPRNTRAKINEYANATKTVSFAVPDDEEPKSPVQQAPFTRHSADNINTQFVNEENGNFEFSAGTDSSADDFSRARNKFRGRQSPLRNEFRSPRESGTGFAQPGQGGPAPPKPSGFDASEWEDIGPHIFVPKPPARSSVSPTRPIRPMRKPRPVRASVGAAGVADEDSTSGEERAQSAGPPNINGSRSPNAMDIDPPQPEPAPEAQPPVNEPRNINVEPTKPEWRAGNVGGDAVPPAAAPGGGDAPHDSKPAGGAKFPKVNLNSAGSEDMEEFMRPMFAEFKNVEPFTQKPSGLNSFADLSQNLPFQSRPSVRAPIIQEKPSPLVCPAAPQPPKAPHTLTMTAAKVSSPAWNTYAQEFEAYLAKWSEWDKLMLSHFSARQAQLDKAGFAWVIAGTGDSQQEKDYVNAQELDKPVRQKWLAAHDAHEIHIKEFQRLRWGMMRAQR